jgi:hypothetical protein
MNENTELKMEIAAAPANEEGDNGPDIQQVLYGNRCSGRRDMATGGAAGAPLSSNEKGKRKFHGANSNSNQRQ